jgi:sugar phosphate isomerase/epimerase
MLTRLSADVTMTPNWTLGQAIDAWGRIGIPAIGITKAGLEEYGVKRGIGELNSSGLRVANYQQVAPYELCDPGRFQRTLEMTRRQLDIASELDADCIYVLAGPRSGLTWDQAGDRLVEQTQALLPDLHDRGLRIALEPLHPLRQDLTFLNMVDDAVELVRRVDDPAVGYVFDFWHLWWQRSALRLARAAADLVFSAQPSDHKQVTLRTLDRAMFGAGIAPVRELVQALEDGGYRGYYDLEVISPDNEEKGYESALREACDGFEEIWNSIARTQAPGGLAPAPSCRQAHWQNVLPDRLDDHLHI